MSECEADHSPPSAAEVKNDGAIPPLLHTHSWHSYLYFTFLIVLRDKCRTIRLFPADTRGLKPIDMEVCY
jgi:hypothetical protein